MTSAYISSTYQDLNDYRDAVYRTLRAIGLDVRDTLEHAVARHERTLDACLIDVDFCDLYIGIFAHRYGFIPKQENPDKQSITELEYRRARDSGKRCLIFLLDEKVRWDPVWMDAWTGENEQGRRIRELRAMLEQEHTPQRFRNPDELAKRVLEALDRQLKRSGVPVEPSWPRGKPPYPGLMHYTAEYAPVYFGREWQVQEVLSKLAEPTFRFLIVSGASGCGKSSLVAAGVIPALQRGAIGPSDWEVIRFVPGLDRTGRNPFMSLAMYLFNHLPGDHSPDELVARWEGQPTTLRESLMYLLETQTHQHCLIFMDQMEELFTLTDTVHHAAFIEALVKAANDPIWVIATIRSDFLGACEAHDALHTLLERGHTMSLWRPGDDSLQRMIREPVRIAGLELDRDLPGRIVQDAGREPGNLPLVAYALRKLYEMGGGQRLTLSDYWTFGGIEGVVGHMADAAFEELNREAKEAFERVFRALITVGAGGQTTRRRAPLSRFKKDLAARALIERFADQKARLLITDQWRGEGHLEVAHEALFSGWKKLADWIEARRDDYRSVARAVAAAREWHESQYALSHLWHLDRILHCRAALKRLEQAPGELDEATREFLWPESRLNEKLGDRTMAHKQRAEFGDVLAALGDPRTGIIQTPDAPPDIAWVEIPGGEVSLVGFDKPFPIEAFEITRYPITHSQFRAFIEAEDGYRNTELWQGIEQSDAPETPHWSQANGPRDTVSWYEAVAFCRWLSARLGYAVRLPTEFEWQQAATGADPEREYPWGAWEEGRCDSVESGLNRTIAVGLYPHGTWAGGPLDMAGNVWEWCLNKYNEPETLDIDRSGDWRALRGGSWYNVRRGCRAAHRNGAQPESHDAVIGFRVVRPPSTE